MSWLFRVGNQTQALNAIPQTVEPTGWFFNFVRDQDVVLKTANIANETLRETSTAIAKYYPSVSPIDEYANQAIKLVPRRVLENLYKTRQYLNIFSNVPVKEVPKVVTDNSVANFTQNATPTVITDAGASIGESVSYTAEVVYTAATDKITSLGSSALDAVSSNPVTSIFLTASLAYGFYARRCELGRRAEVNKKIEALSSKLETLGTEIEKMQKIILAGKESSNAAG